MKLIPALLLSLILAACGTTGTTSPAAAAQITLQGVESAYQVAGQAELVYLRLPTCGTPGATALCATPEKRAAIKAADNEAYAAIVAARAAADALAPTATAKLQAADGKVTALSAAIPK